MKFLVIGNPNTGKSTLFNQLTGLNQKVGNFSGVTIDKKIGTIKLNQQKIELIDLPGTYSIYPKTIDESIVTNTLLDKENQKNKILFVLDASNLKRSLLLFSQIKDLGFEMIVALNMIDEAEKQGIQIDTQKLSAAINAPVVPINAKKGKNIDTLKQILFANPTTFHFTNILNVSHWNTELLQKIKIKFEIQNDYFALQYFQQYEVLNFLSQEDKKWFQNQIQEHQIDKNAVQTKEIFARYEIFEDIDKNTTQKNILLVNSFTQLADKILLHKVWGLTIFLMCLLVIFVALFALAKYPMDFLEWTFGNIQQGTKILLPEGILNNLITDGILAGLGGIVVFIPQIAILFTFIALLEQSGYMARAVFLTDKLVRPFGLNGRSIVPLISGVACAVPAVMAARTIGNQKERLLTILVTPFMSCSARLPVYVVLIALVIPDKWLFGFLPLQALCLLGLYLLGVFAALFSAALLKIFIHTKEKPFFVMELPTYKMPMWKNISLNVWEKVKIFVIDAGKIILSIAIILWFLGTYGPSNAMENAEKQTKIQFKHLPKKELENKIEAAKLENSYMGIMGKTIEPMIAPLGYDWKIGIALIASFAAREVFVGTISTIYSLGQANDDISTIQKRLQQEKNELGKPRYNLAVCFSLLVFYAFAMQCMSTLGAVYRETKSWQWTLIQLFYMTFLAYMSSFLVYNLLK
jgi:ferrous iron transport protein B